MTGAGGSRKAIAPRQLGEVGRSQCTRSLLQACPSCLPSAIRYDAPNRGEAARGAEGRNRLWTRAILSWDAQPVKTHTIGTQTFAIFDRWEKGGVWMIQFIWGKKDFRIYLGRAGSVSVGPARLATASGAEAVVTRLQYLYDFEWHEFVRVADHGLASEKVQFRFNHAAHYVELPKDFYDIGVEICCREFGLTRLDRKHALAG